MSKSLRCAVAVMTLLCAPLASAQGDLEINTPAVSAVRASMQQRHAELAPHYASGAIGLTRDGRIALRDASGVPLVQRAKLTALVAAENKDRGTLYREIARANGHPEWAPQVEATFAQRWLDKAQAGWWVQGAGGEWARK